MQQKKKRNSYHKKNMRTFQKKIYNTIKIFYHENKNIKGCMFCAGIFG